jgi:hypothetical protein
MPRSTRTLPAVNGEAVLRNKWPKQARVQRRALKAVLRNAGVRPSKKQWLTNVQTTSLPIPQWAKDLAFKPLTIDQHSVWFKGRPGVHAKELAHQDKQAGGEPEWVAVEYRLCGRCRRVLLGPEASARRMDDITSRGARKAPCSIQCQGGNTDGSSTQQNPPVPRG